MRTWFHRRVGRLPALSRSERGAGHLADGELVRLLVASDDGNPSAADAHLTGCSRCAARLRALQGGLQRIAATAEEAFDDAVPAWRLARQRRRIQRRIQRAAGRRGSARILRFPTAGFPVTAGAHPIRRRLSLAAAAGLLITAGIGQVIDGRRESAAQRSPVAAAAPAQPSIGPPAGPPQTVADEQFMRELEEALTSSRVTPLLALDEMTPRVRDVAINIQ